MPSLGRAGMPGAGGGGYCVCVTVARGGRFTGFATGCPGTGTPLAVSQLAVEGAVDMVLGPATREGQRSTLTLSFARMVTEAGDAEADARASAGRPFTLSQHAERRRI